MNTNIHIVVEPETIRPGHSGPATGTIWLMLNRKAFPDYGWNDFVVVILEAWASAIERLLVGASDHEVVHFMEGPYEAHICHIARDVLLINGVVRNGRVILSDKTRIIDFVDDLQRAANSVLARCRSHACWSHDAEKLDSTVASLKRILTSVPNG